VSISLIDMNFNMSLKHLTNLIFFVEQHCWTHGQDWFDSIRNCFSMDVGGNSFTVVECSMELRCFGTLLVSFSPYVELLTGVTPEVLCHDV